MKNGCSNSVAKKARNYCAVRSFFHFLSDGFIFSETFFFEGLFFSVAGAIFPRVDFFKKLNLE